MIIHTESFKRAKKQSQSFLDFVILVCTAVPFLDDSMRKPSRLPQKLRADHFKKISQTRLPPLIKSYQEQLSRAAIINSFSFFEDYVHSVLDEIISFHGGEDKMRDLARKGFRKNSVDLRDPDAAKAKCGLRTFPNPQHIDRYRKHSRALRAKGHRFPTELLSLLGVETLIKKCNPQTGFKMHELPTLLENALHFQLEPSIRKRLDDARGIRNKIAHGSMVELALSNCIETAVFLHKLAEQLDKHIVENFMIIEAYA